MRLLRKVLSMILCFGLLIVTSGCGSQRAAQSLRGQAGDSVVRVGILFSTTGSSAVTEKSMIDAAYLAFDEINKAGGIHGKRVQYIQDDYCSDPSMAAKKAEELIVQYKVAAIIGCYTSASRKAVLPILSKYNCLLIYPTYTEGEESDWHVIYTGAMPNQQATQYLPWLMKKLGKTVYLVGNDYVFPVTCNKQAKRLIERNGGVICGEEYVKAGCSDFTAILNDIKRKKPDFIYCDLVGDSVISFYKQYQRFGLNPAQCPIAAITADEMSLQEMGAACAEGHYASMNYFSTLNTSASKKFVQKYNAYAHDGSVITSLAETTYDSCFLLAKAAMKVKNPYDTDSLIRAFSGLEFDAPQGKIKVDKSNHCTWLYSCFASVHNGTFQIIYRSAQAIQPEPWPAILYGSSFSGNQVKP
ncbi:MAG: transporter substrate-binding protein [Oscillospiraceae bacterium]|nr:transporter substrate-binding protein [Oscillospiraceae bacterium]